MSMGTLRTVAQRVACVEPACAVTLHLDDAPSEVFASLHSADVLVTSLSGFSHLAAALASSTQLCTYPRAMWHSLRGSECGGVVPTDREAILDVERARRLWQEVVAPRRRQAARLTVVKGAYRYFHPVPPT